MRPSLIVVALCGLAVLCCGLPASAGPAYTVEDIGPPYGYTQAAAWGLNSSGAVTGGVTDDNGHAAVFLYQASILHLLPSNNPAWSVPVISDAGVIAGTQGVVPNSLGFLYDTTDPSAGFTYLTTLPVYSWVDGISAGGTVIGNILDPADGFDHPFIYANKTLAELPLAFYNAETTPTGINNSQQFVANIHYNLGAYLGVLHDTTGYHLLANPGGGTTQVYGINNNGVAVGEAIIGTGLKAVTWKGSGITELASLPGYDVTSASAINDLGTVVGMSTDSTGVLGDAATVWLDGLHPTDIRTLFPPNTTWYPDSISVAGINNKGQIIGNGIKSDDPGHSHGFLLSPTTIDPASVKITSAEMVSAHVLGITVAAIYPSPSQGRTISVSLMLNGKSVVATYDAPNGPSTVTDKIRIDLANYDGKGHFVPKFDDNVTSTIYCSIHDGSGAAASTSAPLEIPLPIVWVHGMATDWNSTYKRIPTKLYTALKALHPGYREDDGSDGPEPADHNFLSKTYPTLVSYDYRSFTEPMSYYGQSLRNFITGEVLLDTYASRVNIVAHSMGGLISRDMITLEHGGLLVNRLIMIGTPNEGAAAIGVVRGNPTWFSKVLPITPGFGVYYDFFLDFGKAIIHGDENAANFSEMCPTYPWYSLRPTHSDKQRSVYSAFKNRYLEVLNGAGLDKNVHYYSIVSSEYHNGKTMAAAWGLVHTWPFQLGFVKTRGLAEEIGPGDGCVPLRSQEATDTAWKHGQKRGDIETMSDLGNVFHSDEWNNDVCINTVMSLFWLPPD